MNVKSLKLIMLRTTNLLAIVALILLLSNCGNKQSFSANDYFVEHIADIETLWNTNCGQQLPNHSALIDIDGDGCEELYLYNEGNNDGMLLCCGDKQLNTIAIHNYKTDIKVNNNQIQCGGSSGTGVESFEGYELHNSQITAYYSADFEFGPFGEKQTYESKNGNGEAQAKQFFDTMKDAKPISELVQWQDDLISSFEIETPAVVNNDISISDIFLSLPDSLIGDRAAKQLMLEGGLTLNVDEMSYDNEKYPNGIAVCDRNYLYLYYQYADGLWEMCYFDNPNDQNVKTVLVTSKAVTTHFLHQFNYFVDSQTFESITTDLNMAKYKDLTGEGIFTPEQTEQGEKAFNNAQESWGNSMVFYDLSHACDNGVLLFVSDIIYEIANIPFDVEREKAFPRVAYNWNGQRFIKQP